MERTARVLIVDDEPDFIELLAYRLTAQGYQVMRAERGAAALEILKQGGQDVVFLDINMPEMNGIETLQRIRAFNKMIPVIVVTVAYQNSATFEQIKALGIAGFFPKESSLVELAQVLEVALRTLKTGDGNLPCERGG